MSTENLCHSHTERPASLVHDTHTEQCAVPAGDTLFANYHAQEWGFPATSDQAFFEKICLEGFQCGLSWRTVLHRRNALRCAFDHFDPEKLRSYTDADVLRLMHNDRIIRNKRKILSVINNAHRFADLQAEFGSLAGFVWSFEPADSTRPTRVSAAWIRDNTFTTESKALSAALKSRGWTFVGPTSMYALMQALGIVNDHLYDCPRRLSIDTLRKQLDRPACSGAC